MLCPFLLYSIVTQSYIYTFFFLYYLPSCSRDWIEFPVLYGRTSLLTHSKSNSLHLPTPNSPSTHELWRHTIQSIVLDLWAYWLIWDMSLLSQGIQCTVLHAGCKDFWWQDLPTPLLRGFLASASSWLASGRCCQWYIFHWDCLFFRSLRKIKSHIVIHYASYKYSPYQLMSCKIIFFFHDNAT